MSFIILFSFQAYSQSFIQLNQSPLLQNPALAGGVGGVRISSAGYGLDYNTVSEVSPTTIHRQNYFASADALLPKVKTGIAFGASQTHYDRSYSILDLGLYDSTQTFEDKITTNVQTIFVSIAPKFTLAKDSSGQPKVIFSPALGVSWLQSAGSGNIPYLNSAIYDINYSYQSNGMEIAPSFVLHGQKWLVGITHRMLATNMTAQSQESDLHATTKQDSNRVTKIITTSTTNTLSIQQPQNWNLQNNTSLTSLLLGCSFPMNKDTSFSFQPMAIVYVKNVFGSNGNTLPFLNEHNNDETQIINDNYLDGFVINLNVRYKRWLTGVNFSSYEPFTGLSIGYQTNWCRAYLLGINDFKKISFVEFSLNVYIKKNKAACLLF